MSTTEKKEKTMNSFMKTVVIGGMLFVMPVTGLLARPCGGQGGPGDFRRMDSPRAERIFDDLNLSQKQQKQLQQHRLEQRKSMIGLRSKLALLRTDLAEASLASRPDMSKIDEISDRIGNVHAEMTKERIRSRVYVRSILTDKQKEIMDSRRAMKAERNPGRGNR
ncbi:hypothetical protein B9H02_11415 [Prosthecochloris sp. HL-130-GSB]|jgi:periplasmic protein CpxP/Spy|nr:hypothetical protein B9H02_11415 [Prosthecochloris sp. HL-130-GSB]